jgi:hypothetical protein
MNDRIDKLSAHSEHLLDAYLGLKQKYALLKSMLFQPEVLQKHGSGNKAPGFSTLRFALFRDCALDLTKLSTDSDSRTPSVRNLISTLREPEVREQLRTEYARWSLPPRPGNDNVRDQIDRIEQQERDKLRVQFDRLWERLQSNWEVFQSAPWFEAFQKLRDKHIAHLEVRNTDGQYQTLHLAELGLQGQDCEAAMQLLEEMVLDINAMSRRAGFAIESADHMFNRDADAFWE